MPIYEYKCSKGHLFEEFSNEPKKFIKCSVCGIRAKHILSKPSIHFHGQGFYSTDYKKKN